MKKHWMLLACILLTGFVFFGCATHKKVERIDVDTTIDLSGRWNDTDSRKVAAAMTTDCLNHPWIAGHMSSAAKKPTLIVGGLRNRSTEHIAVKTFVNDIERAFINSGQVNIVASAVEREEIRTEKDDQRVFASPETIKELGKELGADYMMTGELNTIEDQEGGKKVIFYQVDLTLTNIETNVKTWMGQHKIKKFITRAHYSS